MTTDRIPPCDTCGADAEELCGKGCPAEATRGTRPDALQAGEAICPKCGAICFDGPQHFNCKGTKLQAAISALGAVEVALGHWECDGNSFASYIAAARFQDGYKDREPAPEITRHESLYAFPCGIGRWRIATESKIRANWTEMTGCPLMPAWWKPERRFAAVNDAAGITAAYIHPIDAREAAKLAGGRAITADLTTGEERPA